MNASSICPGISLYARWKEELERLNRSSTITRKALQPRIIPRQPRNPSTAPNSAPSVLTLLEGQRGQSRDPGARLPSGSTLSSDLFMGSCGIRAAEEAQARLSRGQPRPARRNGSRCQVRGRVPNSPLYQSYFCPSPHTLISSKARTAGVPRQGLASPPKPRCDSAAKEPPGTSGERAIRSGGSEGRKLLPPAYPARSELSCLEKMS